MSISFRLLILCSLLFAVAACNSSEPDPTEQPPTATVATTASISIEPIATTAVLPTATTIPQPTDEPTATTDTPVSADTGVSAPSASQFEVLGFISFVQNGRLMAAALDLSQGTLDVGEPTLMSENGDIHELDISPDGQFIAYTTGTPQNGANTLHILSSDGLDTPVVSSSLLPFVPEATELGTGDPEDPAQSTRILSFEWLNDNATLTFNTGIINTANFSPGAHSDLWTYNAARGGDPVERFAAGTAAPVFAISPFSNQVIFTTEDTIFRSNVDGSEREDLIYFDPIPISEYFYYPSIQWNDDGTVAFVTISTPIIEQEEGPPANQAAYLTFVPVDGPPGDINPIFGNNIFYPPIWSGDGQRMAYVTFQGDGYSLNFADGMLQESAEYYFTTDFPIFHSWSPESTHFIYSDSEGYYLDSSTAKGFSVPLAPETFLLDVQWINNDYFIVATTNAEGGWQLDLVPVADEPIIAIATSADGLGQFDVWLP